MALYYSCCVCVTLSAFSFVYLFVDKQESRQVIDQIKIDYDTNLGCIRIMLGGYIGT